MSRLPEIVNPHRKTYPSGLSDAEWEILKPLLPLPKGFGHRVEVDFRETLNSIFDALEKLSKLEVIWVDQGYLGEDFAHAVKQRLGDWVRVDVIEQISKTFERLPKRWIVERTFGWLNRFRRLSKDYELYTEVSEAMVYVSLIRSMVKRLAT